MEFFVLIYFCRLDTYQKTRTQQQTTINNYQLELEEVYYREAEVEIHLELLHYTQSQKEKELKLKFLLFSKPINKILFSNYA